MPSEAPSTVPRMGSFRRAFLGYRRPEVDAAITARDTQISSMDARIGELSAELISKAEIEEELVSLSGMVIEREREIRSLADQLREANERHERGIISLETVTARLAEIEAQARGQATRIRMKALREAVEVGRRAQELSEVTALSSENGATAADDPAPEDVFEGSIKVEIGPLGDYSQLVGIEDAIGRLGASDISVERFSEGRATLSMNLDEPVELLRELEEHAPLEFRVRRTEGENLVLDVDDEDSEHRAA
jgi:hypothetical protein